MEITTHFFFNLSLLIIVLFFSLVVARKLNYTTVPKFGALCCVMFMLFICIQLSYKPHPEFHYDLRIIPIAIAGLYIGIGPIVAVLAIILRGFYGLDEGFLLHTILFTIFGLITWFHYSSFWKLPASKRINYSILSTIMFSLISLLVIELTIIVENRFDLWFAYLVLPALGVGMIAYTIEFVLHNADIQKKVILTEKMEAVEQMGAAISHEIRNPLTAAMGFVHLMKEPAISPKKRMEYLSIVKEELESAERVIQNYLTFSKPSLGYIEEIPVKTELLKVINILKPSANQNSVEITTNFAILGSIEGDRQKFHQCFLNVIKNSIESMPRGGHIYIYTHYTKTHIIIEIEDTGVGMSQEQIQRLGEPYYSTKGSKGTGLGMMVVFSIVKAMKGTIKVESEINQGTIFTFTFPTYNHSSKNERF
ncbi:sensor histidine kinase [Cytobacillus gottheilii]|uniref:histidine kinase n=1 Tax=Cytobacillus gottheilii TaxID=859144 RepID=A0ABX8FDZ4_9BACI|nr:HAMP domain-containing sensor histidine kinase [Cytobacillus gottheilii]QVY62252.1 HAMP domain-containing histidine kinase [Cytobacillus gottheilii]